MWPGNATITLNNPRHDKEETHNTDNNTESPHTIEETTNNEPTNTGAPPKNEQLPKLLGGGGGGEGELYGPRRDKNPVCGVSDKAGFKPVYSPTETSSKLEISLVARIDMILSKKRIRKALIGLRGCAGWLAWV